jgi:hypothetical protein
VNWLIGLVRGGAPLLFSFLSFSLSLVLLINRNIAIHGRKKISAAAGVAFKGSKQAVELFFEGLPCFGVNAITNGGAFHGALDKAGSLQLTQVLRDGSLRQPELFYQVAADAGIGLNDMLQDGDPGRVRHGLQHCGQLVLVIGEYFGFGDAHFLFVLLQYYDGCALHQKIFLPQGFEGQSALRADPDKY